MERKQLEYCADFEVFRTSSVKRVKIGTEVKNKTSMIVQFRAECFSQKGCYKASDTFGEVAKDVTTFLPTTCDKMSRPNGRSDHLWS